MRFAIVAFGCLLLTGILAAQATPSAKQPASTVAGQVVQDSGGMPLRKVVVTLTRAGGSIILDSGDFRTATDRIPSSAITDAEGHFQMDGIRAGDYRVTLWRNGFVASNRRSHSYSSASLSIAAGQNVTGLLFSMLPAGVIQGKIVDEDGDPVLGVIVSATSMGQSSLGTATTNDLGEYRISGLATGNYIVQATVMDTVLIGANSAEPRVFAPTFYPGTRESRQATRVAVHAGDEAGASFSLISSQTFTVRGRVSGASIATPAGGAVTLVPADRVQQPQPQGMVLPNGAFEITGVLSGSYRALVTAQTFNGWRVLPTSQTIDVLDADVDGLQLSPEPPSQLRGRFRTDTDDRPNSPWNQLNVQLDSDDHVGPSDQAMGLVAKDGSFTLEDVPAGNYHVIVTSNSNGEFWRDFIMKEILLNGKDVGDSGFSLGGGLTSLEIVASAQGSTIEGNVVDDDGKPVPNIPVVCIPDVSRRKRRDIYQQVQTDRQGHFALRGLNPGEYRVFTLDDPADDITDPDFVAAHEGLGQSLNLDSGERKAIVLKLPAESQP
jgi:protocatechuate 3,4-dioxygenase beta subunit